MVILYPAQDTSEPILKASLRALRSRCFEKDLRRVGRPSTVIPSMLVSVWFLGNTLACFLTQATCWLKQQTLISE